MIPITGIKTRQGLGRDSVPRKERNNYETFLKLLDCTTRKFMNCFDLAGNHEAYVKEGKEHLS